MKNQFKDAYIKFISNVSNYMIVTTEDGQSIKIDTRQNVFPHLVGKSHIPAYSSPIPARKFISDVVSDKLDNKVLKTITKDQKRNIENKFKAMESITKISDGNLIYKEGSKIKLGEHIDGDAVIHIAISSNNSAAIVLKKIANGNFAPYSLLWLGKNQVKNKKLELEEKTKIVNVEKSKR